MTALQIALGLLALVLLVAWWSLRRRAAAEPADSGRGDRLDTVIGWPPQPTRILSTQERLAYGTLVRALPEYIVLAQVPLSRFLNVPRRNSYADWLRRIGNQCADLIVCNSATQVVAVVEIQAAQPGERQRKRLLRIQRTLKAAKIPLLVWGESAIPSADTARAQILPPDDPTATATVPGAPPASAARAAASAAAAATVAPVVEAPPAGPGPNPFDELDRDSTQDELIELLEPPPSTWYDELDSGPAPLKKR